QALVSVGLALERLAGRRHPPTHPGGFDERQVDRVVHVTHRVGVGEPDLDACPMAEVAGEVARIRRPGHGDPRPRRRRAHGVTTRTPTIPASAWPGTEQTIRYVPGCSIRNRTRCVWPGRAPASTFARPSTIQSWKTGSSFVNRTTTNRPAGTVRSAGLKRSAP